MSKKFFHAQYPFLPGIYDVVKQTANAALLCFFLFITGTGNSNAQTNTWKRKADFAGGARANAVGFNIASKGYIGTGNDDIYPYYKKDFWEYDPTTNAWTQKADFGGTARSGAVGFGIGSKGYIGTGYDNNDGYTKDFWEYDPVANTWTQKTDFGGDGRAWAVSFSIGGKGYIGTGSNYPNYYKDFWEYNPATNAWTQKADFGGASRYRAVGFTIDSKGYIGTGLDVINDTHTKDFWEYDPVANTWTQKADFGGTVREGAVGFCTGSKGYVGTGYSYPNYYKDFWEYDPAAGVWTQKEDFGGTARFLAVGFSIGSKAYMGTGADYSTAYKDFWEYTPDGGCPAPYNLRVSKIADTCARLNWDVPDVFVEHIKVSYRALGSASWMEDRKKSLENSKWICGLTPNATYEWKVRNICADEKTGWVKGPNFTTLPATGFASNAIAGNSLKGNNGSVNAQIIPNPSKGNFTVQMYLPGKTALTTLSLYNNLGEKIWQQDAGRLSGSASIHIALENKLPPGLYVLMIQHGSEKIMQKVVVMK